MAEISLVSLPTELVCEIAAAISVREIICLLECYHNLCQPLLWHCRHQREDWELQQGLTQCVKAGDVHGTRLLLSINADIECVKDTLQNQPTRPPGGCCKPTQYWSSSSLDLAVKNGYEEIVGDLLAHLNQIKVETPSVKVGSFSRALRYAARNGYFPIMKMLLEFEFDSRTLPPGEYIGVLSDAVGEVDYIHLERHCFCQKQEICSGSRKKAVVDHYATVKLLLDFGADCNFIGLHYFPDTPVLRALFKCSSFSNGILKLLVERGANVSSKDVLHGFIESSNQCSFSNEETARLLVNHGADSSVRAYIGETTLHQNNKKAMIELLVACGLTLDKLNGWHRIKETFEDRTELISQLLDLDANIRYRTAFGPTSLQLVIPEGSSPYGCDSDEDELNEVDQFRCPISEPEPEKVDNETCVSFIHKSVKLLLSHGECGSIEDSEGQNLLYKPDNVRFVKLILAHGAKVNVVDSYGQTPLHAMAYGATKAMVETIRLLLKHGADIAAKNADDNTPLHLAVLTSEWEVVKLLIAHGADRNARNFDGETPMDLLSRRRCYRKLFSFNRNKKGSLMTFKYQDICFAYFL